MRQAILIVATLVLLGVAVIGASTSALSESDVNTIRSSCTSSKNTLNRLRVSDALLRVNRGQAYESLSTKTMNGFSARVASNGYDNARLSSILVAYTGALNSFRQNYKVYEERLSNAVKTDCYASPERFFELIAESRELRRAVHTDVQTLSRLIDEYKAAVGDFEVNYNKAMEILR
jgi:hypothetical protein